MSEFNDGAINGKKAVATRWRAPVAKGVKKNISALHGSYRGYNQGCRCDECTAGKIRKDAERKKAKVGS